MKKTYITTVPNSAGAFLKASECLASLGINIKRASYNKAVDTHTIFIDAEGTAEQLAKADIMLTEIGYLQNHKIEKNIVLMEFHLEDAPGSSVGVLRLINQYNFNIAYISSQDDGDGYQSFKVGLVVDDADKITDFMTDAAKISRVKMIDYNQAEKVYDNSIFYNSFAFGLAKTIGLSENSRNSLIVNTNLAMENLEEQGLSPYKTFDSIGKFADLLAACRGNNFSPRISRHTITDSTEIILIEPPCGSNTTIIKSRGEVLFVDSGYALYREEMIKIIRRYVPNFNKIHKRIFITHADLDHCGLLPLFDEVIGSKKTMECLKLECEGKNCYRERNPLHKPYVKICKILSLYSPPNPDTLKGLWDNDSTKDEPISQVGFFDFGELHFEVYEGKGGHLPGETVLIDYEHHIAFTGDIYINLHGLTPEQREYNQYAPILTTCVDTVPDLAIVERKNVLQRLGLGDWQIFGGHGFKKDYSVKAD